jgi:magnesium transporter
MLKAFIKRSDRLEKIAIQVNEQLTEDVVWVDIVEPTDEEQNWIKRVYNQDLPTESEIEEIESSSRFYLEGDKVYINSYFLDDFRDTPQNVTVAFILTTDQLFSLHEVELTTFRLFQMHARHQFVSDGESSKSVLLGLFETKVDHLADVIEEIYADLETISKEVLSSSTRDNDMEKLVTELAKLEDLHGKVRINIMDQQRVLSLLHRKGRLSPPQVEKLREILQDLDSLIPHTSFLFNKINVLMNATLSFVNIQQNKIIKIFSVASVVFLPPTLIASIYGMNFDLMPELKWGLGYPWALSLMIISGIAPYWYFKRKGWL